ncbi:MAG: hypothetical protein EOO85_03215 [Pedobacter sp.]|nr:MAG: hypothetical protein EOO85_03215 [Pedobacter sp.]
MAKDIKALQCPKCGSNYKQDIRTNFYKCQNCGTEYFLDSDDVHIYHHQQFQPPLQTPTRSANEKLPGYLLFGAVLFIGLIVIVAFVFQPGKNYTNNSYSVYKTPRSYGSSFVYTNSASGDPIYLRLGIYQIDKGNNKYEQELHAQFNNAIDGSLIADRLMDSSNEHRNCSLTYRTYSAEMIYAIGCDNTLYEVDTKNNKLTDITKKIFKDFPQLSSGVGRLDFDYNRAAIKIMNNEGDSFLYFPINHQLVKTEQQANQIWNALYDDHFFEFAFTGNYSSDNNVTRLIENTYNRQTGEVFKRDLTPERKYFSPAIVYQDESNLIIVINTTAASDPPAAIQRIDVETGKVLWTMEPDRYYLYYVTKCRQGYAIEYRKGQEADYMHGVMVISEDGVMVNNYKLGRTE